ncbi:hypothetical protein [Rhizobium leguminosarum]|uniref:hypothetical protein n=1 Tax=Rhizobium leguminosarum TaxID=384 RepID=UPI0010392D44|nr:hypothetical protein [Rhizobium leguminosarum]TCA08575.1 hypothetical protein E0H63_07135 [Rhizobium leguminosarum bv. viciae]
MKHFAWLVMLAFETQILASCSSTSTITAAYGPSPVLSYASVSSSTNNYTHVRNNLVLRAGFDPQQSGVDWYEVTRAGFDYVDEQCDAYLGALYRLRRDRDTIKSQLVATGTATTSILGFVDAAPRAILITAAAFGLATQLSDNATNSLLFAMDPADVQSLVKSQTTAYRAGAAAQRVNYNTGNAAMEGVRGYLNLCLPISIEAQIKATLQGTLFVARTTNFGVPEVNRIQTAQVSVTGLTPSKPDIRKKSVPIPPGPKQDALSAGLTDTDLKTAASEMSVLQKKLCVAVDGKIGPPNSETRQALAIVQAVGSRPRTGYLDLQTKTDVTQLSDCNTALHKNVFEHVEFSKPGALAKVQNRLKAYITEHKDLAEEKEALSPVVALAESASFVGGDSLSESNRKVLAAIEEAKTHKPGSGVYSYAMARWLAD